VTVGEVEPVLERHLAAVFDLAFSPAPEAIADELRPVTV
jgi:hypothetical protein